MPELEHPLPPGMRDLLPEDAASRRALAHSILERFALHGYRLVTPPAFEFASVIERGLKTDPAVAVDDVIRFIEPESGEVAVLRPDLTPQIARIVATRLGDRPPPHRLAYEGTVLRRRASSRAKKHRQIPQVGVELCGVAGAEGDLELLRLTADVLERAGLTRFVIDLSDAAIVRELLVDLPAARAVEISRALGRKDEPALMELGEGWRERDKAVALSRLHGGRAAVVDAIDLLAGTRSEAAARRLLALFDAATAIGLGPRLAADPGDVRGLSYYTGTIFTVYADGPGEPIAGGGRYDDLLARYGAPQPAVGLGIDLDALAWALGRPNAAPSRTGVVVVGPESDPRVHELRSRGIAAVAVAERAAAQAYARAWHYAFVWDDERKTTDEVVRVLSSSLDGA